MIKFTATCANGDKLIAFGLSVGNIARLKEGKPIHVDLREVQIEGFQVMIFAGETEESMMRDLEGFIGERTTVRTEKPQ